MSIGGVLSHFHAGEGIGAAIRQSDRLRRINNSSTITISCIGRGGRLR